MDFESKAMNRFLLVSFLMSLIALTTNGAEEEKTKERVPEGLVLKSMSIWPEKIELQNQFAKSQLLITGQLETGERVDLTRLAKLTSASEHVKVTDAKLVRPVSPGTASLSFKFENLEASVPVTVNKADFVVGVEFVDRNRYRRFEIFELEG